MPAQLKRLIPMFIIFIGLFLVVRHFLIPDSFGQYGHYRGDSLIDIASKELIHASKEDCYDCHDDIQVKLENDMHAVTYLRTAAENFAEDAIISMQPDRPV